MSRTLDDLAVVGGGGLRYVAHMMEVETPATRRRTRIDVTVVGIDRGLSDDLRTQRPRARGQQ